MIQKKIRSILLVEDELVIQQVYAYYLNQLGFHVDRVATGQQALCYSQQYEYVAMILDIGLPDISGEVVLTAIRKRETSLHRCLPVIVITAHGDQQLLQECQLKGANFALCKPVTQLDFRAIFSKLAVL